MKKILVAAALVAAVSTQAFAITATTVVTGTVPAANTVATSAAIGTITGFTDTSGQVVSGSYDTTVNVSATNNQSSSRTISAAIVGSGSSNSDAGFLTPDFGNTIATADNTNSIQVSAVTIGASINSVGATSAITDEDLKLTLLDGANALPAGDYKGTVTITLAD